MSKTFLSKLCTGKIPSGEDLNYLYLTLTQVHCLATLSEIHRQGSAASTSPGRLFDSQNL